MGRELEARSTVLSAMVNFLCRSRKVKKER